MALLRREIGTDFVITSPAGTFFNINVSRIVPADDGAPHMRAEVRLADDANGNYDGGMDPVVVVKGIDVLDMLVILKEMCKEVSHMTGVHVQ